MGVKIEATEEEKRNKSTGSSAAVKLTGAGRSTAAPSGKTTQRSVYLAQQMADVSWQRRDH